MSNNHSFYSRNVIENVIKNFDNLISSSSVKSILEHGQQIAKILHCDHEYGFKRFIKLKNVLNVKSLSKWNRVSSILRTLNDKANQKEYSVRHKLTDKKILVIGGGLSGLRAAIELLLLGAEVVCVEKRDEFSRNNVIHLWPNVINDMHSFEAKRFYGQFCVGSIDHISIRQLQLILLKIALLYGLRFVPNITFEEICPRIIQPNESKCNPEKCNCCCHVHGFGGGAYAHFKYSNHSFGEPSLNKEPFDVIIGCDGRRNTFSRYFPRNNRRGKLAIGLTANYVNRRTEAEVHCAEISGISRIYYQKWFKDLQDETDIELENLVYYRDETHYFVMTATKTSLLKRGVLKSDYSSDSHALLDNSNIDIFKLMKYSKDAAEWSSKLQCLEFALNSSNKPDVALFDFTSMYSATNASCSKKIYLKCCDDNIHSDCNSKFALMLLCGDSLLEPFWPTGSGAGRGFLSAMDAAWSISEWFCHVKDESSDIDSMLDVISRREYVYRLLAQTTPENTTHKSFTLDPQTRYKNLNLKNSKKLFEIKNQVRHLIIENIGLDVKNYVTSYETKRARRATVGVDPEDIYKAKNLPPKNLNAFDDFTSVFSTNKPVYLVPSLSNAENNAPNCDNLPIEVIELKPKNSGHSYVDFKPRNSSLNVNKKNYQARNHFLNETDENKSDNEFKSNSSHFQEKLTYKGPSSTEKDLRIKKFPDSFSNKIVNLLEESSSKFTKNDSYFAQNKQKKSLDIIEKAQFLEQKFEDSKKAFVPKLSKVGKIENEDWNVKVWNSTDIFAPKIEKKNNVYDNSKELLQSRIKQLNNNLSNDKTKNIIKLTPKNKVTNDYVNLLSNEVTQKLSNSIKKVEPLNSVELLKMSNSFNSSQSDSSQSSAVNNKSAILLKPLGECDRCCKMLTAVNRVSFLGKNFHRSCLTCELCSVILRTDEIVNDEFVCKICLKTRSATTCTDSRNAFFTNQISVPLFEAKKNFLVNIEQIDLRERAEFEILDDLKDNDNNEDNCNSEDNKEEEDEDEEVEVENNYPLFSDISNHEDSSETELSNDVPEHNNIQPTINEANGIVKRESFDSGSSVSNSTSSTVNDSDNNYTDDEHSDSDDFICKNVNRNGSHNESTFLSINNVCVDHADNDIASNIDYADANECLNVDPLSSDCNPVPNSSNGPPSLDSNIHHSYLTKSDHAHNDSMYLPYPSSDSSLMLDQVTGIQKEIIPCNDSKITTTTTTTTTTTATTTTTTTKDQRLANSCSNSSNDNNNKCQNSFPIRYSGQFTEKFYRTHSQPTLFEQLSLIDRKLKKTCGLQTKDDLPFVDGLDHISSKKTAFSSSNKLSPASVAKIDDDV